MNLTIDHIITLIVALTASTGLWGFLSSSFKRSRHTERLLLGLAHDRVIATGTAYIDRGWITPEEYDDFVTYLWGPYEAIGGNGLARKIMKHVENLPIIENKE